MSVLAPWRGARAAGATRLREGMCVCTYFSYPSDVLVAALLVESEVLVEPEAHVVAIETVRRVAEVEQVLLKCRRDGRLAGRGEAGEPDGEAALLAERVALAARQRRVPCDVAAVCQFAPRGSMAGYGGAHVAIVSVVWGL